MSALGPGCCNALGPGGGSSSSSSSSSMLMPDPPSPIVPSFAPGGVGSIAGNGQAQPATFGNQQNAGAIGPAGTVTFTTTAIQPQKSGIFMVWGRLSANNSGVSTQTGTLRLDVAGADTVIANALAGTGGAGPFDMGFLSLVTVSKNATHTFSVRAVASAGTNTIPSGDASINFLEL